ncbi:MAG: dephospho-CoA kinase [Dysgonamonadaceae bacterium]|jgi:dephospho-CoA kinase|nr:dephospho-CoA kinase [Dysgonamonadaceae bacterium]
MTKMGITGGIGSGKSVVAELFRLNGVPVYDADVEAKKLNDTSPVIREKLTRLFGDDLYVGDKLDRKKLAQIIFSDARNLEAANAVIHPELKNEFEAWAARHSRYSVVALDAALLFEAKFSSVVDKIVTVYAPLDLRIDRASIRDRVSESSIKQRAMHQIPDEMKAEHSDFVIYNDGRLSLIRQVGDVLKALSQNV